MTDGYARFPARLPASLHARLRDAAHEDHRSMNDFIIDGLRYILDNREKAAAMTTVRLYATNADNVYGQLGQGPAWNLGPVTPDLHGMFAEDAESWLAGDWEPSPANGQAEFIAGHAVSAAVAAGNITLAATWTSAGGVVPEPGDHGAAVRSYLEAAE
jgi:hypothetical protein